MIEKFGLKLSSEGFFDDSDVQNLITKAIKGLDSNYFTLEDRYTDINKVKNKEVDLLLFGISDYEELKVRPEFIELIFHNPFYDDLADEITMGYVKTSDLIEIIEYKLNWIRSNQWTDQLRIMKDFYAKLLCAINTQKVDQIRRGNLTCKIVLNPEYEKQWTNRKSYLLSFDQDAVTVTKKISMTKIQELSFKSIELEGDRVIEYLKDDIPIFYGSNYDGL